MQIRRIVLVQRTEGESGDFESNTMFDWQPVKSFQDRQGMSSPSWFSHYSYQSVLHALQPRQVVDRRSVEYESCNNLVWNQRYHTRPLQHCLLSTVGSCSADQLINCAVAQLISWSITQLLSCSSDQLISCWPLVLTLEDKSSFPNLFYGGNKFSQEGMAQSP